MSERYYVSKGNVGYVIYQEGRTIPLPFNYISLSGANEACLVFNNGGYKEVAKYYYIHKVAGNRDISHMLKNGINPYEDWMKKNEDMFKPRT